MSTNRITIKIEGLDPAAAPYETLRSVADVFEKCLYLIEEKSAGYGDAWVQQGWMGNLARIMSKTSRLKNMLWRDMGIESTSEPITDTLLDLVNLSAFMIINRSFGNRWGDRRG